MHKSVYDDNRMWQQQDSNKRYELKFFYKKQEKKNRKR
jgi:hypothetical protein